MKSFLIACSMVEDELNEIINRRGIDMDIVWLERGYHDIPENLNKAVQEKIDECSLAGADRILIMYGLCGNGAVGWKSDASQIVMPRFDDCVNMMLCINERDRRNYLEPGKTYLTAGWAKEKGSLKNMIADAKNRYGEKRGIKALKRLLDSYHHISIMDTGCYEMEPIREYADECARILDMEVELVLGTNRIMEKLLTGEWDSDIIVKDPGQAVTAEDFDV